MSSLGLCFCQTTPHSLSTPFVSRRQVSRLAALGGIAQSRRKYAQKRIAPSWRIFASEVEDEVKEVAASELDSSFVPVLSREDLPKGERREVLVDGKQVAVFWYRNEVLACEARSPAEGAYSVGFCDASFTENYGIICPGTGTVFSLKTGEILDWYPTNAVLRSLIPKETCRPLEVYPVQITKDNVYVAFKGGNQGGVLTMRSKGGSNTSLEANNVFGIEPTMYFDGGSELEKTAGQSKLNSINPASLLVGILAVAIVSVSGTAVAIYYESIVGGIIFWVVLFSSVAFFVTRVLGIFDEKP